MPSFFSGRFFTRKGEKRFAKCTEPRGIFRGKDVVRGPLPIYVLSFVFWSFNTLIVVKEKSLEKTIVYPFCEAIAKSTLFLRYARLS